MALYRIEVFEVGESIPTDACATKCANPIKLAHRYLRFVNSCYRKPGGYDRVVAKARVVLCGIWPDGDSYICTVRARQ